MEKKMSKPEWGIKRICPSCGIKYYDFDKTPITCPKCNFEFDPDLLLKSRKGRGVSNKVEESEKIRIEDSEDNILNEEKEIDEVNENDGILEIDENEEINEKIDTEIEQSLKNTLEEEIDDNSEQVPFIEEDLEEDEISIEISEDKEKD
tara:strand:- start:52 stop:498 length:447 start_codon:yes stop_codon:yes gene_type:complete